jgi:hypothetical protein
MYLIRRLPDLRSSRRPRSINSRSMFGNPLAADDTPHHVNDRSRLAQVIHREFLPSAALFLPAKKAKLENNLFQSRHPAFVRS